MHLLVKQSSREVKSHIHQGWNYHRLLHLLFLSRQWSFTFIPISVLITDNYFVTLSNNVFHHYSALQLSFPAMCATPRLVVQAPLQLCPTWCTMKSTLALFSIPIRQYLHSLSRCISNGPHIEIAF